MTRGSATSTWPSGAPHADWMIKAKAFVGVAFGPNGKITVVEMKGPASLKV